MERVIPVCKEAWMESNNYYAVSIEPSPQDTSF